MGERHGGHLLVESLLGLLGALETAEVRVQLVGLDHSLKDASL